MLLLSKFKIKGHSMEPLLSSQDMVLASIFPYLFKNPRVNDIVVFEDKKRSFLIKRITKIENNMFFVTGDNKADSLDSRNFGEISRSQILGKVVYKFK